MLYLIYKSTFQYLLLVWDFDYRNTQNCV